MYTYRYKMYNTELFEKIDLYLDLFFECNDLSFISKQCTLSRRRNSNYTPLSPRSNKFFLKYLYSVQLIVFI